MTDASSLDAVLPSADLDLTWLSSAVSAERPAGDPLEDEVFALEQRAAPQLSLVEGTVDQRNWSTIREDALALLQRSRNLKLAVLLTQALLNTQGWAGFCAGLAAIQLLLEKHWSNLHPALTDGGEAYRRVNVLAALASPDMLGDLRKACALGAMRLQSLLDDNTKDSDLRQAFVAAQASERAAPAQVVSLLQGIRALMAQRKAELGDLEPLLQLAGLANAKMRALMLKFGEAIAVEQLPNAVSQAQSSSTSAEPLRELGSIRSPADVLLALERICAYYEEHERSSPVPLLLNRAKHLVNRSFVEAVQDLADKGLPQVQLIMGSPDEPKPG